MTTASNRPECESIQELMPEYALGSLLPDEAESVKDHARVCSVCRRELGAYELVVDGLLVSQPPIAPALLLRDRVMRAAGMVRYGRSGLAIVWVSGHGCRRFCRPRVGLVAFPRLSRLWPCW